MQMLLSTLSFITHYAFQNTFVFILLLNPFELNHIKSHKSCILLSMQKYIYITYNDALLWKISMPNCEILKF